MQTTIEASNYNLVKNQNGWPPVVVTDLVVVDVCLKVIRDFDSSSLHVGRHAEQYLLADCV